MYLKTKDSAVTIRILTKNGDIKKKWYNIPDDSENKTLNEFLDEVERLNSKYYSLRIKTAIDIVTECGSVMEVREMDEYMKGLLYNMERTNRDFEYGYIDKIDVEKNYNRIMICVDIVFSGSLVTTVTYDFTEETVKKILKESKKDKLSNVNGTPIVFNRNTREIKILTDCIK